MPMLRYLKELSLWSMTPFNSFDRIAESFSEGVSRNISIEILTLAGVTRINDVSQMKMMGDEFFQCNHNLSEILVQYCPYGQQRTTMLALTRSLK